MTDVVRIRIGLDELSARNASGQWLQPVLHSVFGGTPLEMIKTGRQVVVIPV